MFLSTLFQSSSLQVLPRLAEQLLCGQPTRPLRGENAESDHAESPDTVSSRATCTGTGLWSSRTRTGQASTSGRGRNVRVVGTSSIGAGSPGYVVATRIAIRMVLLLRRIRLMELDEQSGRTLGRLGYTGPTNAHAIGGMAALALRYSIISASTAAPIHYK